MFNLLCDRRAVMDLRRMFQPGLGLSIESSISGGRSAAILPFEKSGWNPSGTCHRLPHRAETGFCKLKHEEEERSLARIHADEITMATGESDMELMRIENNPSSVSPALYPGWPAVRVRGLRRDAVARISGRDSQPAAAWRLRAGSSFRNKPPAVSASPLPSAPIRLG